MTKNEPRKRRRIPRELPSKGTVLRASFRGIDYQAVVKSSSSDPAQTVIVIGDKEYRTMTSAAKAITGHAVNGWRFWKTQ